MIIYLHIFIFLISHLSYLHLIITHFYLIKCTRKNYNTNIIVNKKKNMDEGLISNKLRSVISLVDKLRDIHL
jgi:hypothetical protein